MRRKTRGDWIQSAIESMLLGGGDAMRCLMRHGAHACTDVTGFGLIGHLIEMLKASGAGAEIFLDRIPLLAGVEQTLEQGIVSSLQPQNLRSQQAIENLKSASKLLRFPILFDPQTAGGFLASVAQSVTPQCVAELQKLGYPSATVIGRVTAARTATSLIAIVE